VTPEQIAELRVSCDQADSELHPRGAVTWGTALARELLDAAERWVDVEPTLGVGRLGELERRLERRAAAIADLEKRLAEAEDRLANLARAAIPAEVIYRETIAGLEEQLAERTVERDRTFDQLTETILKQDRLLDAARAALADGVELIAHSAPLAWVAATDADSAQAWEVRASAWVRRAELPGALYRGTK
jgi:uncharacterized protein YhaN